MREPSALGKALSRALDANVRYTALATKLAATAVESAFSIAAGIGPQVAAIRKAAAETSSKPSAAPSGKPGSAAILLEGPAGSTATGFFVVENSLPHEISTPVEVSALIAPDGRQIQSALRFDPGVIVLAAGEQVVARVTARISRRLVAGTRYQGEILVPGVAGARIPIVLMRTAEPVPPKTARKTSKSIPKTAARKPSPAKKSPRKRSSS